jgi:large subunit ribosomal protein L25
MANEFKIEVHKRELSAKKSDMKNLRKEQKIPGIFYSFDSKDSIPLYIDQKTFVEASKSGAKIFNIVVGKDKKNVIFKSIQYHPVTDNILHVDLYGVDMNRKVSVKTTINLTGIPIGVANEGGVLVQSLNEIDLDCLPGDIPDGIEADISQLSLGEVFKVADLNVPDQLEVKTPDAQTIASVTHAMQEEETVSDEEGTEFMDGDSEKTSEDDGTSENEDSGEGNES